VKRLRRHFWTILIAIGAAVLIVLLALIAFGVLTLPGKAPPTVTIARTQVQIVQGTTASGQPWFGPSVFNITGGANGYPISLSPGQNFSIWVILQNFDTQSHTLYSAQSLTPFTLAKTIPTLPATVTAGQDDAGLQLFLIAPSTPGSNLVLYVTINAVGPG